MKLAMIPRTSGRRRRRLPLLLLTLLPCCMFRELHQNLEELGTYGLLRGRVSVAEPSEAHIVIAVYSGPPGAAHVVDTFVLLQPGSYFFIVPAGTYRLAAFEDRDGNLVYDPAHDPATQFQNGAPIIVAGGQALEALDLAFRPDTLQPLGFAVSVPPGGQRGMRQIPDLNVGVVTTLDDARFSDDNARMGLWAPVEFLFDVGAGIYFLEPYDAHKTPVLFVHGADGSPANWTPVIEHLDRTRFQPWLAYYPTALPLELDASGLDRWMQRLYATYRFPRLIVVAHSMGGLVSRAFINHALQHSDSGVGDRLCLFVTLSTPWGGDARAALGIEQAPAVAPSWLDMAPGSPFLQSLLAQPLPESLPHYLLFSYGGGSRLRDEANDGVVTLASELDRRAQFDAVKVYGFNDGHMGILQDPQVTLLLNSLLAASAD